MRISTVSWSPPGDARELPALELVNVHGGRSWLEAGPNGGSTISVLLPLAADGVDDNNT